MNILKKWLVKQLTRKAQPYLKSFGLFKTHNFKSAIVWEPKDGNILVLAPHPDDEVIGCGGALYKHIQNGANITVVYLTDGRYGSSSLVKVSAEERIIRERKLVETRRHEAQMAMQTLGIQNSVFMDAERISLDSFKQIGRKLRKIINSFKPDMIYLPFFWEEHSDHSATSQILLEATDGSNFQFDCLGYEVWTPLFPNCFVIIDDAIEVKKKALSQYQSQLVDNNYMHTALGLNAYRSSSLSVKDSNFVEAFFLAPLQNYRELYRSYCNFSVTGNLQNLSS